MAQRRRDAVGYVLPTQNDTYNEENNSPEEADSSGRMNYLKNRKAGLKHGPTEHDTLPIQTELGSSEDTQGMLLNV